MKTENQVEDQRGSAMILTFVVIIAFASLSGSAMLIANSDRQRVHTNGSSLAAQYVAQAGFEAAVADLRRATGLAAGDFEVAWDMVDALTLRDDDNGDGVVDDDDDDFRTTHNKVELRVNSDPTKGPALDRSMGTYTVKIRKLAEEPFARTVAIESVGTIPKGSGGNYAQATISGDVRLSFVRSPAFQYCYYMNHFGWMSSSSNWKYNGNMGCAGVFNWYNSPLEVNGTPQWHDYDDDTGKLSYPVYYRPRFSSDAEMKARDPQYNAALKNLPVTGGTIAGYEVVDGVKIKGSAKTEYPFQPNIGIPLLTPGYFASSRKQSYEAQSSVKVGGKYVCDGVYGDGLPDAAAYPAWRKKMDDAGYKEASTGNLYLEGTSANPIELNGSVVVEGNLAIKGVVKGQGSFYVKGNAYILDDVTYQNSPDIATMKVASTQDKIETWIAGNKTKDSLGIYARGTVGIGAYGTYTTNGTVSSWLNNASNESDEAKNGYDGMPKTKDLGESDPKWNVQRYTQQDADKGLIPPGSKVNDPVPGTGEDFDGNGKQDARITQQDFRPRGGANMDELKTAYETINSTNWGNAPATATTLSNASSSTINRLDVAVFTNKAFSSWMGSSSGSLVWNGILVSRLEAAIIQSAWEFNYDRRLMGGGGDLGFSLPRIWQEIEVSSLSYRIR